MLKEFTGLPTLTAMNPMMNMLIQKLFDQSQNNIFAYRKSLANLNSAELQHKLYKESVIKYSGPDAWYSLFNATLSMCDGVELPLMLEMVVDELENASELKNGLTDYFLYNADPEQNIDGQPKSDLSWTPYGKEKLRERSEKINQSVTSLQAYCRGYLARRKF